MKIEWTKELIIDFRRKRDDFEYFKESNAKNQSYVAALFAHALIFTQYSHSCVMAKQELRKKIRDEVETIVRGFFDTAELDLYATRIGAQPMASSVHFVNEQIVNLKGRSTHLVYFAGDKAELLEYCPWFVEMDDYPNVYKTNYGR